MDGWTRSAGLTPAAAVTEEIWAREHERFVVKVRCGKKTDLLRLKKDVINNLPERQRYFRQSRVDLYTSSEVEDVPNCMVCGASSDEASPRFTVYGAAYCQCRECTHVYVVRRPTEKAIARFYASDTTYSSTYTDKAAAENRLRAIAEPWVTWLSESFHAVHGRPLRRLVDVGSGGGHFVEACRRNGIDAQGIEISAASRAFASEVWGLQLDERDFLEVADEYADADAVTFWGLLEHVVEPKRFLDAALRITGGTQPGMVVGKLPRWESLSTAAQSVGKDTVLRHLDPRGHIMCFTDASAAELFYRAGLRPSNAWYYGMDVYELMMQMSNRAQEYTAFLKTGAEQVEIQQWVDEARFADAIVLAGIPRVSG